MFLRGQMVGAPSGGKGGFSKNQIFFLALLLLMADNAAVPVKIGNAGRRTYIPEVFDPKGLRNVKEFRVLHRDRVITRFDYCFLVSLAMHIGYCLVCHHSSYSNDCARRQNCFFPNCWPFILPSCSFAVILFKGRLKKVR